MFPSINWSVMISRISNNAETASGSNTMVRGWIMVRPGGYESSCLRIGATVITLLRKRSVGSAQLRTRSTTITMIRINRTNPPDTYMGTPSNDMIRQISRLGRGWRGRTPTTRPGELSS